MGFTGWTRLARRNELPLGQDHPFYRVLQTPARREPRWRRPILKSVCYWIAAQLSRAFPGIFETTARLFHSEMGAGSV